MNKYYLENRDRIRAYQKIYQASHKLEAEKYRLEHKEEAKKYRLEHKEELRAFQQKHQLKHKKEKEQYYIDHKEEIESQRKKISLERKKIREELRKQYYLEHKEEIDKRNKNRRLENKDRKKDRIRSWINYFPKEIFCEICAKKIFFNISNCGDILCFDHKHEYCKIKRSPTEWLKSHYMTEENKKIWESCDFGHLCNKCNLHLPTKNRKEWVKKAIEYSNNL